MGVVYNNKAYILVGNTGTGKGVKTTALEKSCGSFVGTFDINNFVHNPNNGADAAKQLSWLKKIVHTRIALSSEARANMVLCGMLLKMVVSGGDTITLRTNHKDEIHLTNRSTLFMMCNGVPKIQPCDDAVQDRIGGVFDMQVEFKEKPNHFRPDHEKPRDPGLKDMLNRPEYQAAFLSTLFDAYQQYKHTTHSIPASVSSAIQEWVTNDCGLGSLLAEMCESHLDTSTRQPEHGTFVPFDDLFKAQVVDGVGPQRNKVCMTKTKLGKQLTLLGYPSDTKLVAGKKARVRLGLSLRHVHSTIVNEAGTEDY
jgi:phage/plasmid-associated DNA primase